MFRGKELDRAAWSVSRAVAARLADEELLKSAVSRASGQTGHPGVNVWRPGSLAFGDCGLALLFGELGEGWESAGHRFLENAVKEMATAPSLSLFEGLSGVSCAAFWLSNGGARYRGLRDRLDQHVRAEVAGHAESVAHAVVGDGAPNRSFDLISGIAGWGTALLAQGVPASSPALGAAVNAVVHLLAEQDERPRITTSTEHMIPSAREANPDGAVDLGLAHGLPGLLAFASLAARVPGLDAPGLPGAVRWGATWLARIGDRVRDDATWPHFVALTDQGEPGESGPLGGAKWCYGAAGVARAMWLAGAALDDDLLRKRSIEIAREMVEVDLSSIISPGFCHGLAGLLAVLQRFALDTGLEEFRIAGERVLAELLDRYDESSLLGFRDVEYGGNEVDNPGLLSGAAGIALTLAGFVADEPPRWHRIFLIG